MWWLVVLIVLVVLVMALILLSFLLNRAFKIVQKYQRGWVFVVVFKEGKSYKGWIQRNEIIPLKRPNRDSLKWAITLHGTNEVTVTMDGVEDIVEIKSLRKVVLEELSL